VHCCHARTHVLHPTLPFFILLLFMPSSPSSSVLFDLYFIFLPSTATDKREVIYMKEIERNDEN
jgi:hypothetical protein